MSLLTILQDACRDLSLPVLTSVVGNTESHAPLMLRNAKEELNSLATRFTWQVLTKENTFTTIAAAAQTTASAIPTDFDRMVNESIFNRTQTEPVWGPITPDQWQNIQSSLVTLVDSVYRLRGGTILISPTPSAGQTIAYEYISTSKARSSGGTEQTNWQADADTTVFREDIVTLGVVWRYRKSKGYDFTSDLEEYERRVSEAIMRDGSKPRLYSNAPTRVRHPYPPRTPDTLVF
jgi:hypothetical protein